jgi:molybdopterin-guanine dinucleotide biosynthesis protein
MRIVVGGLARKTGKTALVCRVIALTREKRWTAVKVSHHAPESGAAYELMEEQEAGESGDTRRYLAAGAARAYWMKGDLEAGLEELRGVLAGAENWIVESTRGVRLLEHDYALVVVDTERMEDGKVLELIGGGGEAH